MGMGATRMVGSVLEITMVKVAWVVSLQSQERVLADEATHHELAVGLVTERPWTAVRPAKEAARTKRVRATMMKRAWGRLEALKDIKG